MANPESLPHSPGERCLAAVMFTDVANFSSEMEKHEDRALAAVNRDFQLMSEIIARHKGKLLKKMGDALLAHFPSATNAVACAQEIQLALNDPGRVPAGEMLLKHRIGIHVGDILVMDDDVAGNGVNIAARLQTRAEPGGICISQTVLDTVKHQLVLRTNYLGPQELKNISESVPAYQILAGVAGAPASKPVPEKKPGLTATFSIGRSATPSASRPVRREKEGAGCLVLLGDFSGRASRGIVEPVASRRPIKVDCDNFDQIFAKHSVRLRLPACNHPDEHLELRFDSLEQFHPDQLLRNVPSLAKLLALRADLLNPARSAAAASELQSMVSAPGPDTEADDDVLARLLGKAPSNPQSAKIVTTPKSTVDAYIKSITASSVVPARGAKENAALATAELELTAQLRAILHHPDFQALEAGWRGVDALVREFGGEEELQLLLLDVSREELAADGSAELIAALDGRACIALLGNYFFGGNAEDMQMLGRIAKLAESAGAPFLGGARPELSGWDSFARQPNPAERQIVLSSEVQEAWEKLRKSPEAAQLTLTLPRVLQRQPYGKASEPIESFPFEELPASLPHESYLWGNAVFACGHLLAREFLEEGWELTPHGGEVGGLPTHNFMEDGERAMKPCAEAWLTERSAGVIQSQGLMPVMSIKGRDAVLIPYLRSIAQPAKPLSIRCD